MSFFTESITPCSASNPSFTGKTWSVLSAIVESCQDMYDLTSNRLYAIVWIDTFIFLLTGLLVDIDLPGFHWSLSLPHSTQWHPTVVLCWPETSNKQTTDELQWNDECSVNHKRFALLFMGRNFKAFSTCGHAFIGGDVTAHVMQFTAAGKHLLWHHWESQAWTFLTIQQHLPAVCYSVWTHPLSSLILRGKISNMNNY